MGFYFSLGLIVTHLIVAFLKKRFASRNKSRLKVRKNMAITSTINLLLDIIPSIICQKRIKSGLIFHFFFNFEVDCDPFLADCISETEQFTTTKNNFCSITKNTAILKKGLKVIVTL